MARVEEKVSDGRVLDLIRGWLKADILKGLERWTPTRGSPQGAVISPLLANIFLDPLDAAMAERGRRMVRYADDFVILCRTREEADAALSEVRAWVSENGLALHPEKTHVGDCRQPGQGYEFLGYRFEAGRRRVRQKSLNKFKDSIREKTRRTRGDSLACAVADLNPLLRGWFGYFKHAHHHLRQARRVCQEAAARRPAQAGKAPRSGHLPRRPSTLAKCLLRGSRAVRASHGLVIRETVSMKKPPTGEPYAGKPPVRFGGRGRRKPIPTHIGHEFA